jgi:Protein of unknown function (DUF664)
MAEYDQKAELRRYLQQARDAMVWKLDGLSEYDIRRPLVPTGTNLLGLIKHLIGVEAGYFGSTFGRPSPDEFEWDLDDPDLDWNFDMYATADESRASIVAAYRRTWAHADATIDALPLDAIGHVRHWPAEHNEVTLHQMIVRVIADSQRHAGHADIVRELIDGSAGLTPDSSNLPDSGYSWQDYWNRIEAAARAAAENPALGATS